MWILPERYDRRERLFGISPECFKPVNFALAKDQKLTGFVCFDKPIQKPVKENYSLYYRLLIVCQADNIICNLKLSVRISVHT
jgi:hypothetical protein